MSGSPDTRSGLIGNISLWVSAAGLLAMLVLILAGLAARNFLHISLDMVEEYSGYLLVTVFFFGAGICQLRGAFHHVDLVRRRFPPGLDRFLSILFTILALIAACILLWYLIRFEMNTWRFGERSQTTMGTPLWVPRLAMPVGMTLFTIAIAQVLLRLLRRNS